MCFARSCCDWFFVRRPTFSYPRSVWGFSVSGIGGGKGKKEKGRYPRPQMPGYPEKGGTGDGHWEMDQMPVIVKRKGRGPVRYIDTNVCVE